jgi:hypothetical protein
MQSRTAAGAPGESRKRRDRPPENRVGDRSLVIRNHDGSDAYDVDVQFVDDEDEVVFRRAVTVAAQETVTVRTRLRSAVYRVTARTADGASDGAACSIGDGLHETALVETGNGTVSVVEGF